MHCFGCGTLNAHGLHIKSRWEGDEFVCVWQPRPEHIGFPGYVYGGTIASVVDCHAIWASLSLHCREAGHDLSSGPPPFGVVTGSLHVNYLKPASVAQPLELRARVVEQWRAQVGRGLQRAPRSPCECATAEGRSTRAQRARRRALRCAPSSAAASTASTHSSSASLRNPSPARARCWSTSMRPH